MLEATRGVENLLNKIIDRFFEETREWEKNELEKGNTSFERKSQAIYATYSQLPFQYQSAYFFLRQIWVELDKLEHGFQGPEESWIEIEDKNMRPISFFVEGFFRSVRSAQDNIMLFLSKLYKCQLPGSISKFHKTVIEKKGAYDLPEKVVDIITMYWCESGAKLRDYRDFATHNGLLVLDGHMLKRSDEFLVSIILPNNPEEKSEKKARFTDPTVHIQDTMQSFFIDFTSVLLRLFCEHVDPKKFAAKVSYQRGLPAEGALVLSMDEFDRELSAVHDCIANPVYTKNNLLEIFAENGVSIVGESGQDVKKK